jgi:VWFA-related protein
VATLYQPPFEQPILLSEGEAMTYVRAVAYLEGGNSTEEVRVINAPDYVDELDVQFVELYTTVVDRRGDFIEDLKLDELAVFEDGAEQQVRRFESMRDLPIRAGLVIDTSLSMLSQLRQVKKAAYRFFEQVLSARDRAALITFADEPRLAVRFTSDQEILAGGLAELAAEGETALYDTVIFSLHYFAGLKGKRAIIVLTDGEDSMSEYSYEEAVEFARRTGASIYVIGLGLSSSEPEVRAKLAGLTRETGGELFFIESARNLGRVYETLQHDLRSQYLLAYQSSAPSSANEYRKVEIRLKQKGLEAKSLRGYYP